MKSELSSGWCRGRASNQVVDNWWKAGGDSTAFSPLLHRFQPLQSVGSRSKSYFAYYSPGRSARSAIRSELEVPEVRNSNTCAITSLLPALLLEVLD